MRYQQMSTTRTPKYICCYFWFKFWIFFEIHIIEVENLYSLVVIIDQRSWLLKNIKQNLHLSDKVREIIIDQISYMIGKNMIILSNEFEWRLYFKPLFEITIIVYHHTPFSRFSKSFAPVERKKFPDGIGPVINIALFGIGRAGKLFISLSYTRELTNKNRKLG